ncbi:MAG TPA: DUF6314 family protein [Flavobacterium sp.]|nr:DUF6314 family protein [Flavobacterium sp.]
MKDFFAGNWNFTREIYNGKTLYAQGKGEAVFLANESGKELTYHEKGNITLTDNQTKIPFYRSFLYAFEREKLAVFFNDGMDKGKLYQHYIYNADEQLIQSVCEHLCVADNYDGKYFLTDKNHFRLVTHIHGPKKDTIIHTTFHRN